MTKFQVHIIKMGGTIEFFDPSYDELIKKLIGIDTSLENYFNRILKPHFEYDIDTVAQKDSRELTKGDRERLVDLIGKSEEDDILITHGTFTMVETAKYIEDKISDSKKVILTGSMIPLTGFSTSDAGFNLGFAIGTFPLLKPGVYICMNGGVFTSDDVQKNPQLFRFE